MKTIGHHIEVLRKINGVSQKEMANRLGVAESTVRMWELGKNVPPPKMLRRISEKFNGKYMDMMMTAGYITIGDITSFVLERMYEHRI